MAQQPYRRAGGRAQTRALGAMQKGRGPLRFRAPGEVRRRASKRKKSRRGRARYSSPLHKILRIRQNVGP